MSTLELEDERTVRLADDRALRAWQGGFTAIPNRILTDTRLSLGARMVFAMLLKYAWQDGFCWPAQERLAQDLGVTDRSVRTFLKELRAAELITWKQRGLNRPNVYTVLRLPGEPTASAPGPENISGPDRKPAPVRTGSRLPAKKTQDPRLTTSDVGRSPREQPGPDPERLDYLADEVADQLGDRKPVSVRTFRTIAQVLGEAATFRALGLTREAARDGQVRGSRGAFFVGVAKQLARERGVELGIGNGAG